MTWPEYLEQLATTALLGTELSDLPGKPPWPALEASADRIAVQGKEARFLALAAAAFLYDRATRQPIKAPVASSAAPAETLPLIGLGAHDRLQAMMNGQHPEILHEFLARAAKQKRRVAPRFLPALFARAMKEPELWPTLIQVMGERGRWLAAQNSDWNSQSISHAKPIEESAFQTGAKDERLACLRQVRLVEPARARGWLQASWAEEKPEDRAAFLEILLLNVSMEDESFLLQALTDRRREVREIAQEGLSRLPASALAQRMQARLSDLIRLTEPTQGQVRLEIEIPDQIAAEWQKDGIDTKSRVQGLGDKAYRLYCIAGAVPLSFWSSLSPWTAEECVVAIYQTDWHDALLLALANAAIRQQNHAWGQAVLRFWAVQPRSLEYAARRDRAQQLLESFPPNIREAFLIDWMERQQTAQESENSSYFPFFLNAMNHAWSLGFTEKVFKFFVRAATTKSAVQLHGIRWKELGRFACPEFHGPALVRCSALDETWKPALEPFHTTLGFRELMLKEIAL